MWNRDSSFESSSTRGEEGSYIPSTSKYRNRINRAYHWSLSTLLALNAARWRTAIGFGPHSLARQNDPQHIHSDFAASSAHNLLTRIQAARLGPSYKKSKIPEKSSGIASTRVTAEESGNAMVLSFHTPLRKSIRRQQGFANNGFFFKLRKNRKHVDSNMRRPNENEDLSNPQVNFITNSDYCIALSLALEVTTYFDSSKSMYSLATTVLKEIECNLKCGAKSHSASER